MKRTLTLAAAVVLLSGCGGSGSSQSADPGSVTASGPATAQTATVGMTDALKFSPSTVKAKVGTLTLTTMNMGNTPHNLAFDDSALGKTSTVAGKESQSLKIVFDKAGTYDFTCTFHEGMDGKVVVS